ncbi:Pantothenate kinase PanK and related proteins [Ceraceosorus bombacis]|uniref:Pantothenate kinase PanK and related proteins n=1 Tax=Ceraceosorus bombacis TaxID=401625 RepID=A0A0P1BKC1_9BASI|nr:Pantothenate kinase PanK and related proteins [Ceraceosorus bombacis]
MPADSGSSTPTRSASAALTPASRPGRSVSHTDQVRSSSKGSQASVRRPLALPVNVDTTGAMIMATPSYDADHREGSSSGQSHRATHADRPNLGVRTELPRGATGVDEDVGDEQRGESSVGSREKDGIEIYLPNHTESVSHIALDIGGSLAKVVYFTHSRPPVSTSGQASTSPSSSIDDAIPRCSPSISTSASGLFSKNNLPGLHSVEHASGKVYSQQVAYTADGTQAVPSGTLTPTSISRVPSASELRPDKKSYDGQEDHSSGANSSATDASREDQREGRGPSLARGRGGGSIRSSLFRRRSLPSSLPGGRLNFIKFETSDVDSLFMFLSTLISSSATANGVSLSSMRKSVKLSATGGGAHRFHERLEKELGVEVRREDEMRALITGLNFATLIPDEVFSYSDELVSVLHSPLPRFSSRYRGSALVGTASNDEEQADTAMSASFSSISSASSSPSPPTNETRTPQQALPRPSPDPPLYAPVYDSDPSPKLPCLLVNIGSGVSIIKVDDYGKYERVSGTSLGGGTLWGLLSLLTDAENFDEMLELSTRGDNSTVDMMVGDIYGSSDALSSLGLKSSTIASSFGKVFRKEPGNDSGGSGGPSAHGHEEAQTDQAPRQRRKKKKFRQEDICKSLLYAVSNNIGQIAYMNAEKFNLDRIYFGGGFLRGHKATISTLSYAIRFWSKGTKRAYFLRHEGYLGAIGAWIHQVGPADQNAGAASIAKTASTGGTDAPPQAADKGEPLAHSDTTQTFMASASSQRTRTGLWTPSQASDAHQQRAAVNGIPSPIVELAEPTLSRDTRVPIQPSSDALTDHTSPQSSAALPSLLAEALGGAPLDKHQGNVAGALPHAQRGQQPNASAPHIANNGTSTQNEGVVAASDAVGDSTDLQALLSTLSVEDRDILQPLLSQGAAGAARSSQNAQNEEAQSIEDMQDLLKRIEAADGAVDGLEARLDGFLSRLDQMLDSHSE